MKSDQQSQTDFEGGHEATEHASPAELVAVITVLLFVAVTAGALLIARPQSLHAAATSQPALEVRSVSEPAERPFHERYSAQPGAQVDAPTF